MCVYAVHAAQAKEGRACLVEYLVLVLCYGSLHCHAYQMLVLAKHDKEITFKRAETPTWIITVM